MRTFDVRAPLGPVRLLEPWDLVPIALGVLVWVAVLPAPVESTPRVPAAAQATVRRETIPPHQEGPPPMSDTTLATAPPSSAHPHDAAALRSLVARLAALRDAHDGPGERLALAAAAAGGWDPDALAELLLERELGAERRAEVAAALDRYRVLMDHESPDGAVERVLRVEAARGGA